MNKYVCKNCGYIEECTELEENFTCPICKAKYEEFNLIENETTEASLDAIIDLMVEQSKEDKTERIINEIIEDKRIKISDDNNAITRIEEKCINCGQCKKTCEKKVYLKYNLNECKEPICLGCGQCLLNCPTGAIIPKYSYKEVKTIIDANEKIVVAIVSPAVRVSIGESFGNEAGENNENKLVTGLKKLGFDYVFDTSFGADLTVLEEVTELVERIKNKGKLPQFTSCCPSWVKYAEIYHPELLDNISTCKSPIGMQCAIIKNYFAEKKGFDPSKIITVAITPCTAKKMEAKEYTLNIDYVLTASETSILLKENDIFINELEETQYDSIMGQSSGAGVLFGMSGGVSESMIRTLHKMMTGKNLDDNSLQFKELRGNEGIKEANIKIDKFIIRVAVVQQMENLEKILENDQYKKYHFIEVMNCKGGCVGGGGQPLCQIPKLDDIREKRTQGLSKIDEERKIRFAHDNEEIITLYKEYLNKPFSEISLNLLHTSFIDKSNLLKNKKTKKRY